MSRRTFKFNFRCLRFWGKEFGPADHVTVIATTYKQALDAFRGAHLCTFVPFSLESIEEINLAETPTFTLDCIDEFWFSETL